MLRGRCMRESFLEKNILETMKTSEPGKGWGGDLELPHLASIS